jgi:hypothetical protein
MIVNNAAQQPDNEGHTNYCLYDLDMNGSNFAVSTDSMAYHFCMTLGKAIAESPLFDDVRLCDDTLRYDSLFFMSRPFGTNTVASMCEEYQVDALISLDKLYFATTLYNKTRNYETRSYYNVFYMSIEITGELRVFYPDCGVAYTIPFTDSLIMSSDDDYYYLWYDDEFTTQDVRYAMHTLSEYTGHKMHQNFVPFWEEDVRWFYKRMSSGWKRATAYAAAAKWDVAAKEWLYLYSAATKWKQKARLASNLALCHEIKGDFTRAIEYATMADSLFAEHAAIDDRSRKMQNEYLTLLKKRAVDDETLSKQLKE